MGIGLPVLALVGVAADFAAPHFIRAGADQSPVNFVAVSDRLATAGQPSEAQLARLSEQGYGLVQSRAAGQLRLD